MRKLLMMGALMLTGALYAKSPELIAVSARNNLRKDKFASSISIIPFKSSKALSDYETVLEDGKGTTITLPSNATMVRFLRKIAKGFSIVNVELKKHGGADNINSFVIKECYNQCGFGELLSVDVSVKDASKVKTKK